MLLSGAGLIGLVVFNLWRSVAANEERAVLDARRQADFTATALRGALRDPRFLDLLPDPLKFSVAKGEVVVPASVDWLDPPKYPVRRDLDPLTQEKLDQIEAAADDDQAESKKTLQTLLSVAHTPRAHRDWLRAYAGFWAHRHSAFPWRDELLALLDRDCGGAVPVSACLLHDAARRGLPPWAQTRVPALPANLAEPLLARLRERGHPVDLFEKQLRQVLAHRATLTAAAALLPELRGQPGPVVAPRNTAQRPLLLFHGDARTTGQGGLVPLPVLHDLWSRPELSRWTALPAGVEDDLVQPTPAASGQLVTVVPGYLAVRPREVLASGHRGAWILALVVSALVGITLAGLWVFYRGARRETEAAQARSEFLTLVTHELKTPLAGIRLLSEMLQQGHVGGGAQRDEYYGRLKNESERLTMLIENVLDLGRMERGERVYTFATLDLNEVVAEAVELFRPIAAAARLELSVAVGETTLPIHGDRHALLQALLNVMDNARKYAASGGHLELQLSRRGDKGMVEIRDFGPGVDPDECLAIFERFRRGNRHASGSLPGVGLGLHLSRAILIQHGGSLVAQPPADGGPGVCFRFVLPCPAPMPTETGARR